jgi:CheY-like chemotaxis protein
VAKHILAVDDSMMMREVYIQLLETEGYEVTVAKDGQQAIKLLEERGADLMLLDIDIPYLSGWEVLDIVRKRADLCHTPVIIVSAFVEPEGSEEARTKYDCYVTKKATGDELVALVNQAIETQACACAAELEDTSA